MTLAEFLRIEMRRKHLNQSELARVLGVYPNYVQRWINGYKPRPEQCARIAEALGISANQVMQMAGYPVDTISPLTRTRMQVMICTDFDTRLQRGERMSVIRDLLDERGITYAHFVRRMNLPHQTAFHRIESGKQKAPEGYYERAALFLNVDVERILPAEPAEATA
jgi:transcriptional regulator with XRE-family HTH domain